MTDAGNDYITIEDAARLLGKSERTVYRYAEQGRLATKDTPGGKKLVDRAEVDTLASELRIPPQAVPPKAELVPLSDMLSTLHRKDDELAAANDKLHRAALEIGRLQGQLEAQQKLLTDADIARQRVNELEQEIRALKARRSWWHRLFAKI